MTEHDRVTDWVEDAKSLLETRLVEGQSGPQPVLFVRRQRRLQLCITSPRPWAPLRLADVAVSGFGADELVFASDTYFAKTATNPEGKRWRQGEMQERANEPAVAALLGEAVSILRAHREGPPESALAHYERLSGGRIAWAETKVAENVGGRMIVALNEAVRAPWLVDLMGRWGVSAESVGLSDREAGAHHAAATVRAMTERARMDGGVVMFAIPTADDPVAERIIGESLRRAGLEVEVRRTGPDKPEWWRS